MQKFSETIQKIDNVMPGFKQNPELQDLHTLVANGFFSEAEAENLVINKAMCCYGREIVEALLTEADSKYYTFCSKQYPLVLTIKALSEDEAMCVFENVINAEYFSAYSLHSISANLQPE
jgi:hypothetical protein